MALPETQTGTPNPGMRSMIPQAEAVAQAKAERTPDRTLTAEEIALAVGDERTRIVAGAQAPAGNIPAGTLRDGRGRETVTGIVIGPDQDDAGVTAAHYAIWSDRTEHDDPDDEEIATAVAMAETVMGQLGGAPEWRLIADENVANEFDEGEPIAEDDLEDTLTRALPRMDIGQTLHLRAIMPDDRAGPSIRVTREADGEHRLCVLRPSQVDPNDSGAIAAEHTRWQRFVGAAREIAGEVGRRAAKGLAILGLGAMLATGMAQQAQAGWKSTIFGLGLGYLIWGGSDSAPKARTHSVQRISKAEARRIAEAQQRAEERARVQAAEEARQAEERAQRADAGRLGVLMSEDGMRTGEKSGRAELRYRPADTRLEGGETIALELRGTPAEGETDEATVRLTAYDGAEWRISLEPGVELPDGGNVRIGVGPTGSDRETEWIDANVDRHGQVTSDEIASGRVKRLLSSADVTFKVQWQGESERRTTMNEIAVNELTVGERSVLETGLRTGTRNTVALMEKAAAPMREFLTKTRTERATQIDPKLALYMDLDPYASLARRQGEAKADLVRDIIEQRTQNPNQSNKEWRAATKEILRDHGRSTTRMDLHWANNLYKDYLPEIQAHAHKLRTNVSEDGRRLTGSLETRALAPMEMQAKTRAVDALGNALNAVRNHPNTQALRNATAAGKHWWSGAPVEGISKLSRELDADIQALQARMADAVKSHEREMAMQLLPFVRNAMNPQAMGNAEARGAAAIDIATILAQQALHQNTFHASWKHSEAGNLRIHMEGTTYEIVKGPDGGIVDLKNTRDEADNDSLMAMRAWLQGETGVADKTTKSLEAPRAGVKM